MIPINDVIRWYGGYSTSRLLEVQISYLKYFGSLGSRRENVSVGMRSLLRWLRYIKRVSDERMLKMFEKIRESGK